MRSLFYIWWSKITDIYSVPCCNGSASWTISLAMDFSDSPAFPVSSRYESGGGQSERTDTARVRQSMPRRLWQPEGAEGRTVIGGGWQFPWHACGASPYHHGMAEGAAAVVRRVS